jgi:death-on-curing protein
MIYLDIDDIYDMHAEAIRRFGGNPAIHDPGLLESAVAQPRMTFAGTELYRTIEEKAAALAFSLACNHGFKDGNKRVAHIAMATFLGINGFRIAADIDEQEAVFMRLADHQMTRDELVDWIRAHIVPAAGS